MTNHVLLSFVYSSYVCTLPALVTAATVIILCSKAPATGEMAPRLVRPRVPTFRLMAMAYAGLMQRYFQLLAIHLNPDIFHLGFKQTLEQAGGSVFAEFFKVFAH